MNIDEDIINYNKVKDVVVERLVNEGLLNEDDAEEFLGRAHVIVYKGKWWNKWFEKNVSKEAKDKEGYYIRMVDLKDREDDVDRLLRRTTSSYDD